MAAVINRSVGDAVLVKRVHGLRGYSEEKVRAIGTCQAHVHAAGPVWVKLEGQSRVRVSCEENLLRGASGPERRASGKRA